MTIQLTPLPNAEVEVVIWGGNAHDYASDVIEFRRVRGSQSVPDHALIGTTDIITASTWVRRVLSLEAVR